MIIMKCKFLIFLVIVIGLLALVVINYSLSYSRRIGNTHFYLVETMALSEKGESLAGLYYRSDSTTGYIGEMTPGFPLIILWNDKYLISKNYDGNHPIIIKYVVINLDSINTDYYKEPKGIRTFSKRNDYLNYLQERHLSESNMNQTDNHIGWWYY